MYDMVISHARCFDGMTAAWVARRGIGQTSRSTLCLPRTATHDLMYTGARAVLEEMAAEAKSLLVLDHHASAELDLDGLPYVQFDMNRSGAGLAWDHFFPGVERLPMVAYVEDRDLWRFALPGSREHHCAMTMYPMDFATWDRVSEIPVAAMIDMGSSVLKFSTLIGSKFADRAGIITVAGGEVLVIQLTIRVRWRDCGGAAYPSGMRPALAFGSRYEPSVVNDVRERAIVMLRAVLDEASGA